MRFFYQLLAVVVLTLIAVLGWDLSKRRAGHGDKEPIIYAGMFGPGEQMQLLYSGPAKGLEPEHPFGPDASAHYAALIEAWPDLGQKVRENYQAVFGRPLVVPRTSNDAARAGKPAVAPASAAAEPQNHSPGGCATDSCDAPGEPSLAERYRQMDPGYIEKLVEAIGRKDRNQRLELFNLFADLHPRHGQQLIQVFQELHPAYTVGLFEDFERRNPQYEIIERWDGRWVLSTNRPRFLTGADVPDLIAGSRLELCILYRENLALPLDQPLADADDPIWRQKGILYGPSYDNPNVTIKDTIHPVAYEGSRYTITEFDVTHNHHPYPAGTRIAYLWPSIVHSQAIFYNKAHFRRIGRDGDAVPQTVDEFEEICRQLVAAGLEPIAQDGMVYIEQWWFELIHRMMGYETLLSTCRGDLPRFAGPQGDSRYLEAARRLRRWRDQDFWMKQFSASKWPGAQRDFGAGKCTFLLTGTWLPAEIARTRSYDPEVFDLSCFIFPACPGAPASYRRINVGAQGHAITRQGRNHKGAVRLLSYLSAYGAEPQATKLNYIPAQKGIPFPQAMKALEPIFQQAKPDDILAEGIVGDLPMFYKFVLLEVFNRFFPIRSDNLTPEAFVEELERKAQEHYQRYGKGS